MQESDCQGKDDYIDGIARASITLYEAVHEAVYLVLYVREPLIQ